MRRYSLKSLKNNFGIKRCPKGQVRAPSGRCVDRGGPAAKKHGIGDFKGQKKGAKKSQEKKSTKKRCPKGKVMAPTGTCVNRDGASARKYGIGDFAGKGKKTSTKENSD